MSVLSLRTAILVLCIITASLVFGTVVAGPVLAAVTITERPENEFLILELRINGRIRDRATIAYLPEQANPSQVLVPLGALSKALSYAIKVNPVDGIAEGFFLQESNLFQLDLERQIVFLGGVETPITSQEAEAHFEDIYVRADILQNWFGLNIELDLSTLRLEISTDAPVPFELDIERQKHASVLLDRHVFEGGQAGGGSKLLPYKALSPPGFIVQQTLNVQSNPQNNRYQSTTSLEGSMDFMGLGTRLVLTGIMDSRDEDEIQTSQLTFQRRDPNAQMLGPLKAGKIALGDVDFPDAPLIKGRDRGRGLAISSDPSLGFTFSHGPEDFIIDGDAPLGWDAELYRNGHFVTFQDVGDDGRFSFEGVELLTGFNLFQIILYGPEGQTKTTSRRVFRGPNMLREGEVAYDVSLGQPESDFLPLSKDAEDDDTFGLSGQAFYGLNRFLTVGGSVFRGPDDENAASDELSAASVSAITSFAGFNTQFQLMSANEGRRAYDVETRTRFLQANISAGHTEYTGFTADDQDLKRSSTLAANRSFGSTNVSFSAQSRSFQRREKELSLDSTVSAGLFGVELTNSLERVFSPSETQESFEGELTGLVDMFDIRFRNSLVYDLDSRAPETFRTYRLSALKKLDRGSTVRLNGLHDFLSSQSTGELRYSKNFENFSFDVNLGASTTNSYQAGLTLRTALQPNNKGQYKLVSAQDGGLGSVGLRAYVDSNGNEIFDDGEKLLENVEFVASRGNARGATDADGTIFMSGLVEGPTRFFVEEDSLPSIYLSPYHEYADIIPRRGATTTIDFGFRQLGEIDGFIYMQTAEGQKAMPGVDVVAIDVASGAELDRVNSEFDGYYVIPALPLGTYEVRALPIWSEEESQMPSKVVELTNDEALQLDINLILPTLVVSDEKEGWEE